MLCCNQERAERTLKKEQEAAERATYTKAQEHRLNHAVKAGWKALDSGDRKEAESQLKRAQFYHKAMLRLMRGRPVSRHSPPPLFHAHLLASGWLTPGGSCCQDMAEHLGTPKPIKSLRDAIEADSVRIRGTPKRLQAILARRSR